MRGLPLLVATLVLFSGCLDFLDEEDTNQAPTSIADVVGNGPFEPDEIITFTGKDSTDPDGDTLEYYWDFDSNDGNDEMLEVIFQIMVELLIHTVLKEHTLQH